MANSKKVNKGYLTKNKLKIKKEYGKWLTLPDIAGYIGVSMITLYRWTKKGLIPHYKIGRQIRFDRNEVDTWIKSGNASEVK